MNRKNVQAFTLVEVTLALGLAGFCMVTLIGMMPVALTTIRAARDRAAATNCLELIVGSLRQGTTSPSVQGTTTISVYQSAGVYSNFTWSTSATTVPPYALTNISIAGTPTVNTVNQRLAAYVQINPPANAATNQPTTAQISVAWPNSAAYNAKTQQWQNAGGSISTWLVFEPGQ